MSCYDLCPPATNIAVPQPIAESCNELCARQCPDSTALIQPPPVVVTFPGPLLSSFPQQAVVGSSGAPAFGSSLASGGFLTSGSLYNSGTTLGYGSRASELFRLGSGSCIPSTSHWFLRGVHGPCKGIWSIPSLTVV